MYIITKGVDETLHTERATIVSEFLETKNRFLY